jgi:hypothetical protein
VSATGPDAYRAAVEDVVERAIGKLDLEAKVCLLSGFDFWMTQAASEIGLRPVGRSIGDLRLATVIEVEG